MIIRHSFSRVVHETNFCGFSWTLAATIRLFTWVVDGPTGLLGISSWKPVLGSLSLFIVIVLVFLTFSETSIAVSLIATKTLKIVENKLQSASSK